MVPSDANSTRRRKCNGTSNSSKSVREAESNNGTKTTRTAKRKKRRKSSYYGLSFGVEMEMIVQCDPKDFFDELSDDFQEDGFRAESAAAALSSKCERGGYEHLILRSIAQTLSSHGFAVTSIGNPEMTGRWTVSTDTTIHSHEEFAAAEGKLAVIGVELKTPALTFSDKSLEELRAAVELLKKHFQISINQSCQLHVHVGLLEFATSGKIQQARYPLETCQNLAVLAVMFDHQFSQLHPRHVILDNHCKPLRLGCGGIGNVRAALDLLLQADSIPEFLSLVGPEGIDDRAYALNFQNLHADAQYGTVEFRRHEGSFDADVIVKRIELCIAIVRWASTRPDDQSLREIRELVSGGICNVGLVRLLRWLKVEEAVVDWYSERLFDHV